jgi:hypothetical protein
MPGIMEKTYDLEVKMQEAKDRIIAAIEKATADGRLTCERAHELAKEIGVPLGEIGRACNELKIKISACQLGCF